MRLPLLLPVEKRADAGQQSRDIADHDVLKKVRIHLIVRVDQNVSGINHASPGNSRMFCTKLFSKLVSGLANDFEVAANRIGGHLVAHPLTLIRVGVFENALRSISDVKEIEYWVFHRFVLERDFFGKDSVADVGVKAGGFHQVDGGGEQVAKVRLQPPKIEQIATGFEVNDEVDVAARAVLVSSNRAKDANVGCTVNSGEIEYRRPLFESKGLQCHKHLSLLCTMWQVEVHGETSKAWGQTDDITVVTVRRLS